MKHKSTGRKLGRKRNARRALMRSLAVNFVRDEKIKTTEAKAKELRPYIEKMITKGKSGALASRRLVTARIGEDAAKKIFSEIAPKYKERKGGYTRITKLPRRKGDAAKMAIIEFV
ncbi:MAG: 50S ribosomal protein L17 [bacterium]|nr:50S ribosomal protein L17 [bacterium]